MHKAQDRLNGLMFDWRGMGTHKSPLFFSFLLSLIFFIIVLAVVEIIQPEPLRALKQGVFYYIAPNQEKILANVRQGTLLPPYIPAYAQPHMGVGTLWKSDFMSADLTPSSRIQAMPEVHSTYGGDIMKRWFLQLPEPQWNGLENLSVEHAQTSEVMLADFPESWGAPVVCREEKGQDLGWIGLGLSLSVELDERGLPVQVTLLDSSGNEQADLAAEQWVRSLRWASSLSVRSGIVVVEWKEFMP